MLTAEFDMLELGSGDICLDVGCGEGRHTLAACRLPDVLSVGLDLSTTDLSTACRRIGEIQEHTLRGNISFGIGDAQSLPIASESIDVAIASEVLEHIPNYLLVLEELMRVLKPGGRLCISVPRQWPEWICWQLSKGYRSTPGGHIRIFDAVHLRREVERLGFVFFAQKGAHALHVPYWWLKCLFWNWKKDPWMVRCYHRLLIWDLMKRPYLTRIVDRLLNPFMGKSIVLYFSKLPDSVSCKPCL